MKTVSLSVILILILTLTLTACGGASTPAETSGTSDLSAATGELAEDFDDALTVKNQLLLGTIRLEGTADDIAPAQAAQLVSLWMAMKSLTESGTAADEEITAVQNQIIALLTPAQTQAIDAMRLTNANLQEYYIEIGASTPTTPTPGADADSGEVPMSELSKEDRQATKVALGTPVGTGSTSGKGTILLDTVIALLQDKAA